MNLTFNKINNVFVSEFSVTSDFNLHIERSKRGSFTIFQRSSDGGNYGEVYYEEQLDKIKAIDYDFSALIYPKYIKIVSETEPTYAAITTDGEVTEIKTQNKEIEVTANGTITVTPDDGFAYLNKVDVKVDVPTEGGGSSVSEDDILYYFSGTASDCSFAVNFTTKEVIPSLNAEGGFEDNIAVLKLWNISTYNGMSMLSTIPFTVERLDENITNNVTKVQSTIGTYGYSPVYNNLGAIGHTNMGGDIDGVNLLMGGGLFKLITGAGKEYLIKITTTQ